MKLIINKDNKQALKELVTKALEFAQQKENERKNIENDIIKQLKTESSENYRLGKYCSDIRIQEDHKKTIKIKHIYKIINSPLVDSELSNIILDDEEIKLIVSYGEGVDIE